MIQQSPQDISVTEQIRKAGLIRIHLIDHIIIRAIISQVLMNVVI
ncbi:MAG: JAB domain-containing protein [Lachnospira pectinoschiza]